MMGFSLGHKHMAHSPLRSFPKLTSAPIFARRRSGSVDMALSKLLSEEQTQSSLATKRTTDGDHELVSASPTSQPGLLGLPRY